MVEGGGRGEAPFQTRQAARVPLGVAFLAVVAGCGGDARGTDDGGLRLDELFVRETSAAFLAQIGDSIGRPVEARFNADGSRVLVLDRYAPFLRLFTASGRPLWSGGLEGGGPRELRSPTALAISGDTAAVAQLGRLSRWVLQDDSLAFAGTVPLPPWKKPLGAAFGCDGRLVLYGISLAEFRIDPERPEAAADFLNWVHVLEPDRLGEPRLTAVWGEPRAPSVLAIEGHTGALIGRSGRALVVLHRPNPLGGGRYLEFDCALEVRRSWSESSLATGDSFPVLEPRSRPLQWPNGVIALPRGFLAAAGRYASARARDAGLTTLEDGWWTELFLFQDGRFADSGVIPWQWFLMDFHPARGALMAVTEPIPHFIIIPPERLGRP